MNAMLNNSRVELSDKEFNLLSDLIYDVIGINLNDSKKELLRTRLGKRLRLLGISSFKEYFTYVTKTDKEELTHLFDAISTNLTSFFREIEHFNFLSSTVLPSLIEEKKSRREKTLRIWSAACSTGEEPYSIAMTVADALKLENGWDIKILATDISTKVIDKAVAALYPEARVNGLSKDMLKSYFLKGTGAQKGFVKVKRNIRNMVVIRRINLNAPRYPFKKEFDFIFCRNVLIYFDKVTQAAIISNLYHHLKKGGHLFLGHAESLTGIDTPFVFVKPTIYVKK